ncbi:hypothetical protein P3T43_001190 [Paraburkholderia sp. GAS41]|uniref:hypothetical protein n=1 Tax=Paraburkholderia sp. GAS41 TaxID=3035134 RepID=UPI003D1BCB16
MSNLKVRLIGFNAACILACASILAHAASPASSPAAASSVNAPSEPASAVTAATLAERPVVGDDPVAIRDALAKHGVHGNAPSLRDRLRALIPSRKSQDDRDLTQASLDRPLIFVVPIPYGVLYRSNSHVLTIDADLSSEDIPNAILLKKTVNGPDGRGLTVAPEAKAKGFIQQIDVIALKSDASGRTRVHGHLTLPPSTFAKVDGDFAIALMCTLSAPYLSDRHDHSDPTDDEPTDITTRASTLYTNVGAVWLISPQTGTVLSKNLHLSK